MYWHSRFAHLPPRVANFTRFTRQTTRNVSQVTQDTREKRPSNISPTVSVRRCNYNVSLYVNRSNSRRAIKCKAEGDRVVRAIPLVRFRCRRRTKRAPHPPATPPETLLHCRTTVAFLPRRTWYKLAR